MGWQDPPTFGVGGTPSDEDWQTVADDLTFLHKPPRCRAYNDANISLSNDTDVTLTFNQERYDDADNPMHSIVTATSRITVTEPGVYHFGAGVAFTANATGYRRLQLVHSVAGVIGQCELPEVSALGCVMQVFAEWPMLAGEYVTVVVRHTGGAGMNALAVAKYSPEFWASWRTA